MVNIRANKALLALPSSAEPCDIWKEDVSIAELVLSADISKVGVSVEVVAPFSGAGISKPMGASGSTSSER